MGEHENIMGIKSSPLFPVVKLHIGVVFIGQFKLNYIISLEVVILELGSKSKTIHQICQNCNR